MSTIKLTRRYEEDNPTTSWIESAVDGPITAELTKDEATEVVRALVVSYQLAHDDSAKRHLIERILLRLGMELESLDVLPR